MGEFLFLGLSARGIQMNVEQLLQEVEAFQQELSKLQIVQTFGQFNDALAQLAANPSNIDHQNHYKNVRNTFLTKLDSMTFSDAIGGDYEIASLFPDKFAFGSDLRRFIENTLNENTITLGVAVEVLRKKRSELETFVDSLKALTRSLTVIGFHPPRLIPGSALFESQYPLNIFATIWKGWRISLRKSTKCSSCFRLCLRVHALILRFRKFPVRIQELI